MTASIKMAVFCFVAPCRLISDYRSFRGACCFHLQDDHGATEQKATYTLVTYGKKKNTKTWSLENLKGRGDLGVLDIDWRITVKGY
jgi:hypothetical protein